MKENNNDELKNLEEFLKLRMEAAERGEFSDKSVDEIFNEVSGEGLGQFTDNNSPKSQ